MLTAVALWSVAVGLFVFGTTYRDPFGQLKWTDFVHFYTLGHLARTGPVSALYDPVTQHQRQVELVPESATEHYVPVNTPQIALVFAPLSFLSYRMAGAVWALASLAAYAITLWWAWRHVRGGLTDPTMVVVAAAAFPPFWSLVLHGQTTAVPILAFSAGALALSRGRPILAGAALGLLLMKPQFGLMVAVTILACREWALLSGLVLSAAAQFTVVAGTLGMGTVLEYLEMVPRLASMRAALEPRMEQMHSIATVTQLLPFPLDLAAWVLVATCVAWLTLAVWRSGAPVHTRMAGLVTGSVLLNPHLNLYDVAVMAVPLVWLTGWFEAEPEKAPGIRERSRLAIYALYVLLLVPTARLVWIQLSPLVLVWFVYALWRTTRSAPDQDGREALSGVSGSEPSAG